MLLNNILITKKRRRTNKSHTTQQKTSSPSSPFSFWWAQLFFSDNPHRCQKYPRNLNQNNRSTRARARKNMPTTANKRVRLVLFLLGLFHFGRAADPATKSLAPLVRFQLKTTLLFLLIKKFKSGGMIVVIVVLLAMLAFILLAWLSLCLRRRWRRWRGAPERHPLVFSQSSVVWSPVAGVWVGSGSTDSVLAGSFRWPSDTVVDMISDGN